MGKIMILQGVRHQILCLGVCYANDPQKGGYTTPAPALDLTTFLRGDSLEDHFLSGNGDVQGVGHPISYLGVCNVNDPPQNRVVYLSGTSVSCQHGAFSHFFQTFLNFWSNAPKCHLGGGYVYAFRNL